MRLNRTLRTLRVMLVPFALTLLVGGALVVAILGLTGLLLVRWPFAARDGAPEGESHPTDVPQSINAAPPRPTATPLPPLDTFTPVCEANARRFSLAHPDGSPVVAASRLLVPPGDAYAYVIADGRLARVPLVALDGQTDSLTMLQTEPLDRLASNVPLQELADLAYDDTHDALLLLAKSGRVFRYTPGGQWALVRQPELAPDDEADPSYLAISAADGEVSLLDADLNQVWRFPVEGAQDNPAQPLFPGARAGGAGGGPDLLDGVDMLISQDVLLTLDTDGNLRRYEGGDRRPTLELSVDVRLPLSLQTYGGQVYVVDGLRRAVIVVDADESASNSGYRFVFPGMGLLRDAAFDGAGRLLALADNTLIAYSPRQASAACEPPSDTSPPLVYYGADLASALAGFRYPIDDAYLPCVPRAYPGARRLYRAGIHQGLDIHPWDIAGGIDIGEPVRAVQDGIVTRADVNYQPITSAEYNFLTEQALGLGFSLPATLDRVGGRQVFIDHGQGVVTRYLHLDSVADGIVPGAEVKRGQAVGTVGVSGTGREADEVYVVAHAHVEIWIGDFYLGQGLTLRETMWLWRQVFPAVEVGSP